MLGSRIEVANITCIMMLKNPRVSPDKVQKADFSSLRKRFAMQSKLEFLPLYRNLQQIETVKEWFSRSGQSDWCAFKRT
jgi:hypothetical protein